MKDEGTGLEHKQDSRARRSNSESLSMKAYEPQSKLGSFHYLCQGTSAEELILLLRETEVSFLKKDSIRKQYTSPRIF